LTALAAAAFLHGLNPRGHAADPPMPQYRFSPADSAAILQYLKTVK